MHEFTMFHRKRNTAALKQALESGALKVNTETGQVFNGKGKLLKVKLNTFGYAQVQMRVDGVKYFFFVHKLVWLAAGKEIPHGHQIHHLNSDRADPRLENLECITMAENLARRQYPQPEPAF